MRNGLAGHVSSLRWVGLEEKAEQLEKELEQQPAIDTVLAIQSETDYAAAGGHPPCQAWGWGEIGPMLGSIRNAVSASRES